MATYQWMIGFKQSNQRKTILLMVLFPIFLFALTLLITTFFATNSAYDMTIRFNEGIRITGEIFIVLLPIIIIRGIITFFFQKQIMFGFSGAKELTRKENPEIYNIVENLCISRGLPLPKIGIIKDHGMNAFATGRRASDSWVVFTSWLLENLDKREIEAVAAHELSHIINKDSMLMLVTVIFIGIVSVVGEILIRSSYSNNSNNNKNNILPLIGLWFILLGYLVYPLIRLAISRKREFMADLGSVELTKDSQAMISALQKISGNARVPSANKNIAMFFIDSPSDEYNINKKFKKSSIRDTHPSIDERIQALQNY